MPTYQYACTKCGHEFEMFQSMKDAAIEICPQDKCGRKRWGKGKVQRQVGVGAGLIFKGSGFYITDYRSENYKAGAKQDSAAPAAKSATPPASSGTGSTPASGTGGSKAPASGGSKPKPAAS